MPAIDGARQYYDEVTGEPSGGCPWRAFYEPIVADVMELVRACADGPPASVLPLWPAPHLWEGLLHYKKIAAMTEAQNDREDDERQGRRRG